MYTIGFGTAAGGELNPMPQPVPRHQAELRRSAVGGYGGGGGFGGGGFRRGIDEDTLRGIADATGGRFAPAESAGELEKVFNHLRRPRHEAEPVEVSVAFVGVGTLVAGVALLLGRAGGGCRSDSQDPLAPERDGASALGCVTQPAISRSCRPASRPAPGAGRHRGGCAGSARACRP